MTSIATLRAVKGHYEDLAAYYDKQWAAFNRVLREWVVDRLPADLPAGAAILDAGCGTGHVLQEIARRHPAASLQGIDISPAMLAATRARVPQAQLAEADLAAHDMPRDHYNVVLCLNVLHHLNDAADALARLVDGCAPGGTIFLADYAVEGLSMRIMEKYWRRFSRTHARAFSRAAMKDMLARLPVTILDEEELRPDIVWRIQAYKLQKRG